MTWVIGLALLWSAIAFAAALVIGRGLRVADQRELTRQQLYGLDCTPEAHGAAPADRGLTAARTGPSRTG